MVAILLDAKVRFRSIFRVIRTKTACFHGYCGIFYGETVIDRNLWRNVGATATGRAVSLSLYFRSLDVIWDFTQFFSVSECFVHRFPLLFPFARRSLTFRLRLLHSNSRSLAFHSRLEFDPAIH